MISLPENAAALPCSTSAPVPAWIRLPPPESVPPKVLLTPFENTSVPSSTTLPQQLAAAADDGGAGDAAGGDVRNAAAAHRGPARGPARGHDLLPAAGDLRRAGHAADHELLAAVADHRGYGDAAAGIHRKRTQQL